MKVAEIVSRYMLTGLLLAALLLPGRAALAGGAGGEWVLVDSEPGDTDFYYDKGSLARPTPEVISVRVKVVYAPEGKADALAQLKDRATYGDLKETLYLYEIQCKTGQSRLNGVVHLDSAGKVIKEFRLTGKTEWEEIPPGARLEDVSAAECPQGR